MAGRIVIGIHGLRNKPHKWLLTHWWKRSIREGLAGIGREKRFFRFGMAYWADVLHPAPLRFWIRNPENPLFIREKYHRRKDTIIREPGPLRKKFLDAVEKSMDKILLNEDMTLNLSGITDKIIRVYFEDLHAYTSAEKTSAGYVIADCIRERLSCMIRKHRGKRILLIAHSMGTLIAYDVLTRCVPDVPVDTFVTLGSPLGLPFCISRAARYIPEPGVPENITGQWVNLADLSDPVAFNYTLSDDYPANGHGVRVTDMTVTNDFEHGGDRNPHKSYGYLRTPECAGIIHEFLSG